MTPFKYQGVFVTCIIRYIFVLFDVAVEKEIHNYLQSWRDSQKEMEAKFQNLYGRSQQSKRHRGKKPLTSKHCNKDLSTYAGSLTKEFLIKVSVDL